ncbi:uncharacterized protein LOC113402723 [Vanessa tameamea]|uniref:Uncharacterized protein LOC113402723 n=1 Tax=Vanessa tameamea TaxID=334116 RepID=A0ABM4AU18_VANTA
MKLFIIIVICFLFKKVYLKNVEKTTFLLNQTRRILRGQEVTDTRPYMVYLRPASGADPKLKDSNWLCGGVIIHSQFILTSAACIEDAQHFVVVSGTHRWLPPGDEDECIVNGAKKAVWKCVPKNYVFDGNEFDNIRWMVNDIAVVKVEDDFNFERRIRGCDFTPKQIAYNNKSAELESPGTVASIAGWGSVDSFSYMFDNSNKNSPNLIETDVLLISKAKCKKRWAERYHYIIDENMVCAKDGVDIEAMSDLCKEQEISCKELTYSDETEDQFAGRRFILEPESLQVHGASHFNHLRRSKLASGGFCENDHGGPLVVGVGRSATVIGVISACMTANFTQKCYGPFLYTSVWSNRHVIACAIDKSLGATCRRLLKTTKTRLVETKLDWTNHHDRSNIGKSPSDSSKHISRAKPGAEKKRTRQMKHK